MGKPKIELKQPQRTVEYFGLQLIVPFDTGYLSTNIVGLVYAHSDEPWTEPGFWEGYELGEIAEIILPNDLEWDDTLVKYPYESLE